MRIAGCTPAYPTRGKGALGPILPAPAGASKRETPTSNLIESTANYVFSTLKTKAIADYTQSTKASVHAKTTTLVSPREMSRCGLMNILTAIATLNQPVIGFESQALGLHVSLVTHFWVLCATESF